MDIAPFWQTAIMANKYSLCLSLRCNCLSFSTHDSAGHFCVACYNCLAIVNWLATFFKPFTVYTP